MDNRSRLQLAAMEVKETWDENSRIIKEAENFLKELRINYEFSASYPKEEPKLVLAWKFNNEGQFRLFCGIVKDDDIRSWIKLRPLIERTVECRLVAVKYLEEFLGEFAEFLQKMKDDI